MFMGRILEGANWRNAASDAACTGVTMFAMGLAGEAFFAAAEMYMARSAFTAAGQAGAAAAARAGIGVQKGMRVWRVFGGKARPHGQSWTTVNPRTVPGYRNAAGLPNVNKGTQVVEGILDDITNVTLRPGGAASLDGNAGGLAEVIIPNAQRQVRVLSTSSVNPPF